MTMGIGALGRSAAKKVSKNKMGTLLGVGLTSLFALPEIPKIKAAVKEGKGLEQTLGSAINFGKWLVVPALLTGILNPVGGAACAIAGLGGFIAPSLIPEIDVMEKKDQGVSCLA